MPSHSFRKAIISLSVAGAVGLSAIAQADVVIAVAGPMTGANAAYGDQYWRGAQQAASDINAAGGINGEKISLVKADDACEPKQAVAAANRLVDSKNVNAVVGNLCSSSVLPASEIYDEAGILSITPSATNPKLSERGLATFFRMCGRDDQQGVIVGNYILDTLKGQKIAVIHDKDTYGQGLADAVRAQLNKRGTKEIMYEGLTRGEKDFNALVTKIRASGADIVYYGGLHPEAGPLIRQLREQGVTAKFVSGDGIVTEDLVSAAGGAQYVNGVLMAFGADPRLMPDGKEVVEKFRAAGYEPEGYTLYSYASVQAIAAAFNGVGSTKGVDAANWLKAHPVHTVMGTKEWDSKGDLKSINYVMYQWGPDGKYKQL